MNGQQQFNRIELDRLVYSLMLSDNQCVILLKSLKEKDMLKESVDMHHDEIKQFLQVDDHTKRIKNVNTVFRLLQYDIDPSRWTFDIAYYQSCKRLYCYLDDKHKKYEPVVFMESQGVADPFEFLKQALEEARYEEFKWKLNGDFSKKLSDHFENNNGKALTSPDSRSNGQAEGSKVLPANGVSREVHEDTDPSSTKFNKIELDRLVRSLKLTEEQCVILLKSLKEKDKLEESICVNVYDKDTSQFCREEGHTMYIKDVAGLLRWLHYDIDPTRWTLEIVYYQSFKRLYCYLVDKREEYKTMTFLMSREVFDPFELLKNVLEKADYKKYNWTITGDFSAKLTQWFK